MRAQAAGIESVFDVLEADEAQRGALLAGLSEAQVEEVARACNRYPSIEVQFEPPSAAVAAGGAVQLTVQLERELEAGELGPAVAPRYPKSKEEAWWLVVGSPKKGTLSAIKRVTLVRKAKVKLEFNAPAEEGAHDLALYFMCDSYLGADQEHAFTLQVTEAEEEAAEEMETAD